jgi:S-adenosylmethionine/arginine decarboxylase-like enzyme
MTTKQESKSMGSAHVVTISPFFLIVSLLIGVPLSYYAGRIVPRDHPFLEQLHASSSSSIIANLLEKRGGGEKLNVTATTSSPQEERLDAATYIRTVMRKFDPKSSECVADCPAQEEVALEELYFPKPYGRVTRYVPKDEDDEKVDPLAAHVIMDMERLSSDFLKDADRIRQAIFDTVWEASEEHDIAILSVHCQELRTTVGGVMCVAILKDGNHMTVVTDPIGELCSIDLFITGEGHLLKVVPMLENHFAANGDEPLMRFRQSFRGERAFEGRWDTMDNDITELLLEYKNDFFFKKEVSCRHSPLPFECLGYC